MYAALAKPLTTWLASGSERIWSSSAIGDARLDSLLRQGQMEASDIDLADPTHMPATRPAEG
jgi:hypothetical protein